MSYISESVPDLLGGVSQLAPQRRAANEVESMVNCQLRPAEGVVKRPPTKWIAEVAPNASIYSGAFVHAINKNANERFWVIVLDGDLKVFNAVTGAEVTVTFPDGKTYLDVVGAPNEKFRLATFNDTTVIINREIVVDQKASLSDTRGNEALIVIQQTDFAVRYYVGVNFGSKAGSGTGFGARWQDSTSWQIAEANGGNAWILDSNILAIQLASRLSTKWGPLGSNMLTITTHGGSIHITPGPNLPAGEVFKMGVWDGLSNKGMTILQDTIQGVEDLPPAAPVDFVIKVEGNPDKTLDDVFYRFSENGSWVETVEGGIPTDLDETTMPLELVANPDFLSATTLAMAPVSTLAESPKTPYTTSMLQTEDGAASTRAQAIMQPSPNSSVDRFWNLGDANGADVILRVDMLIDQTKVVSGGIDPTNPAGGHFAGDLYEWELAIDIGAGYVVIENEPIGNWQGTAVQFKFGSNVQSVPANSDVRLRVTSNSGNKGSISITPELVLDYEVDEGQRLFFPTSHYAPSTALSFTLNGVGFSDTFTAGGTRAAYLTNLKTVIEAYGGTAVTATIDVAGGFIDLTNDNGTQPTIATYVFDDNLDLTTDLFNGAVDFTTFGIAANDTLRNDTDSSAALVSTIAATVIVHGALTGGVNNAWAEADNCVLNKLTTEFICRQPTWPGRTAGSLETNKWPSFKGETINEVAFLKNRLVFLSDENVAMSEVDSFFNFFRSSTIDVLDSDRIDVALSGNKASSLHSAFVWNETLLTWSELGQFVINGEPFLSPNTVRREATTSYINTRKVKPVASERGVYFLTEGKEFCQLWDYRPTNDDASSAEGNRLSVQVPRYMPGTPRGLLAVSDPEIVLVLTSTDPEKLYVYTHLLQDQDRTMAGWHEWSFEGVTQILGIGSIDNEVSLIFERDDGKVHLEVLDMWELSEQTLDGQEESDDHTTPPFFGPNQVVLAKDTFTEPNDDTLVTSGRTNPPDTGFGLWEYNGTELITGPVYEGGYVGLSQSSEPNVMQNNVTTPGASFRCTNEIGDGDMHAFVDMKVTQTGGGFDSILSFLINSSRDQISERRQGAGIKISATAPNGVTIHAIRYHAGFEQESSLLLTDTNYPTGTTKRWGFRRVGAVYTYYSADRITGANETSLGSFTMGSQSTTGIALLADGNHTGVTFFCNGGRNPISNNWEWDNMTVVADEPGGGTSTFFTPDGLDPDDFSTLVGIDESGDEQALISNGDGTARWPTDDKTNENIIIGLPVASTIVLSKLYHRKNFGPFAGQAEMRGATYISLLQLGLLDTTSLTFTVDITGHVSFTQTFAELNSLDAEIFHSRVGGRNNEVTLTISDSTGANFKIVGYDWEGTYYNRTRRLS